MTSRTTRSVTVPVNSPFTSQLTIFSEFEPGRSKAKMKTLESRNALFGIFRFPYVLPKSRRRDPPPGLGPNRGPQILGPQESEIGTVPHEGRSDGLGFCGEQSRADQSVEEGRLRTAKLNRQRGFHSKSIALL